MSSKIKVCVIGAGAAGLCTARHLCRLPQFFTVDVIESAAHVGGAWINNPDKCCDRTNLPKEIIAFPDFYFDPHLPSFVSHTDVRNYLQQYTDQFQLLPHIQFNTTIVSIACNKTSYKSHIPGDRQYPESESPRSGFIFNQWNVVTRNVHNKENVTKVYDTVLICDCNYPVSLMFDVDGLDYFAAGKPLSYNLVYNSCDVTYLDKNCGVLCTNGAIQTLYKHVFNTAYPSMAFIGVAVTDLPFLCYDLQVRWVLSVWTGFISLPSADVMKANTDTDYTSWRALGQSHYTHLQSERQWEYYHQVAVEGAISKPDSIIKKLRDTTYHYKTIKGEAYKNLQFAVTGHSSFLELTEHKSTSPPFKIAIIGAGVSGIGAARHCSKFPGCLSFTVYEQGTNIGGTWIYTPRTGLDEMGQPVHTSMYKNLISNAPHELMAYCDFPFPPNSPTFPTQHQTMQYLENYCKHYNLNQHIKFKHRVDRVSLQGAVNNTKQRWLVQVTNLRDNSTNCEEFDSILVCNGHYSKPFLPKLQGLEKFPAEHMIHSHAYRTPDCYVNRVVLIVGAGISGKDITPEVASVAKEIVWSVKKPVGGNFPSNVSQYPCIERIEGFTIYFDNGVCRKVEKIILCTGYKYSFPFLDDSCEFSVVNHKKIWPLYKNTFNAHHPTMAFLAMMKPLTFIYRDLQMMWILRVWLGLQQLPSMADMIADCKYDTHAINLVPLYQELASLSEMQHPSSAFAKVMMQHDHNLLYDHPLSKSISYYLLTSKHWISYSS